MLFYWKYSDPVSLMRWCKSANKNERKGLRYYSQFSYRIYFGMTWNFWYFRVLDILISKEFCTSMKNYRKLSRLKKLHFFNIWSVFLYVLFCTIQFPLVHEMWNRKHSYERYFDELKGHLLEESYVLTGSRSGRWHCLGLCFHLLALIGSDDFRR